MKMQPRLERGRSHIRGQACCPAVQTRLEVVVVMKGLPFATVDADHRLSVLAQRPPVDGLGSEMPLNPGGWV